MRRSGQTFVVLMLVVSLVGSAGARWLCIKQRRDLDRERGAGAASAANVSKLNGFALGLLLGGLRGPLLMALWTTSENQKTERDLDDFDTKVELIRLLQAEFDAVHLFQIWNKAFNISVQMANVPTKYTTILDGMDYAFSVDAERPDNINILSAIGGLYFDKFGGASERQYFRPRLMDETLPPQDRVRVSFPAELSAKVMHEARVSGAASYLLSPREDTADASRMYVMVRKDVGEVLKTRLNDPRVTYTPRPIEKDITEDQAGRRVQHESLLTDNYRIKPEFLAPRTGATSTLDGGDGSKLPYLEAFAPYPYGVSPYALAYNYYKRAQWLHYNKGARHLQLSERVVSSRPALSLKKWAEEDWTAGRRGEMEMFNLPYERNDERIELPTANIPLGQPIDKTPLYQETLWRYQNAARISDEAVKEYQFHLSKVPTDEFTYGSHLESSRAQAELMRGDAYYLEALASTGAEREQAVKLAREAYVKAANLYTRHVFTRFMDWEDPGNVIGDPSLRGAPMPVRIEAVSALKDSDLAPALARLLEKHKQANFQLSNSEEFQEFHGYITRCYIRLGLLGDAKPAP